MTGSPPPGDAESRPQLPERGPEKRVVTRASPEIRLIYGDHIWSNPVPANAGEAAAPLHVTFAGAGDAAGTRFTLDAAALSKHLLILGGIGTGKTNVFSFILEALLKRQGADDIIFVFDTKKDFAQGFFHPWDPRHALIGNGAQFAEVTRGWNVFGEIEGEPGHYRRSDDFTAKEIGKQLFEGRGSETQPFFQLAAADLVSKVLIDFERQARRTGDRSRLTNRELVRWFRKATLADYMALLERNPDFLSARLYFGDPGRGSEQKLTAQALGVFGYINAMVNDLFTGVFEDPCPGGEFSMRQLVRSRGAEGGKTVVFVEYDLSVGEVLGPMYRLLFDLALKEALGQNGDHRGNVIFLVDELKLLPNLMHLADALNFGRSLGVKVVAGLQCIDQLYESYGEEKGRSILSGFMNCFAFRTPDSSTRRYVSQRFGENYTQLLYRTRDEQQSCERPGHTVEDWDLVGLEVGQAAVDLAGERPFIFRFADFKKPHEIL